MTDAEEKKKPTAVSGSMGTGPRWKASPHTEFVPGSGVPTATLCSPGSTPRLRVPSPPGIAGRATGKLTQHQPKEAPSEEDCDCRGS